MMPKFLYRFLSPSLLLEVSDELEEELLLVEEEEVDGLAEDVGRGDREVGEGERGGLITAAAAAPLLLLLLLPPLVTEDPEDPLPPPDPDPDDPDDP